MTHIFHKGEPVAEGETFEPTPGYKVIYVRMESDRLILKDAAGEFSRRITDAKPATEPRPARRVRLGERRTVLEEMPDARPIVGETIYLMTHQVCVPGGWDSIAAIKIRAPHGLAGVYGPAGQMLEDPQVRRHAAELFDKAGKTLKRHPYRRLDELTTMVQLQQGTGEVGGWDDPGVSVQIADLIREHIL